jgi:hypothetical protein
VSLHKVINYGKPMWVVHWAKASNEELAKRLPAEDVTADTWWHWRSLCGKDLIAHLVTIEEYEVSCKACLRAYEKGKRQAEELAARFG